MPATATSSRNLLTVEQAADILQMHPDSVRRSCREGRIPCRKISGRVYIAREAISAPVESEPKQEEAA